MALLSTGGCSGCCSCMGQTGVRARHTDDSDGCGRTPADVHQPQSNGCGTIGDGLGGSSLSFSSSGSEGGSGLSGTTTSSFGGAGGHGGASGHGGAGVGGAGVGGAGHGGHGGASAARRRTAGRTTRA